MDKTRIADLAAALDAHATVTSATDLAWAIEMLHVAARLYDEAGLAQKAEDARYTAGQWQRIRPGR